MGKGTVRVFVWVAIALSLYACGNSVTTKSNGATLTSIAISPSNSSITIGATQQFAATGTYSDNTTQNLTLSATWLSSNTNNATILNIGLATGVASGTTTIVATVGNISGTTSLTITSTSQTATLVSIAVSPANPSIAAGATKQFTATGTYSDNTTQNITGSVTWTSSNQSIAAVNSSGLGTGVSAGTTTISATSGGISGTTTLTISAAGSSASLSVTPVNPSIARGGTQQLTATLSHGDGTTSNVTSQAAWSSSNLTVATVTSGGFATGVAAGTAIITGTSGTLSGTTTITVTSSSPGATSTLTFNLADSYGSDTLQLKLYDETANLVWPSATTVWTLTNGNQYTQAISCTTGDQICYGATTLGRGYYWGVGVDNSQSCTSCCTTCANASVSVTFGSGGNSVPGGTSTMTFTFGDSYSGGNLQLKFYDETANFVWPSATTVWSLTNGNQYSESISCTTGDQICYGAAPAGGGLYWGVGVTNAYSCSSCCTNCATKNVSLGNFQ